MMLDDKIMWPWSLLLVLERSAVDCPRPQTGRGCGDDSCGPTSMGTRQTPRKRPSLVRMKVSF